jgi:hypothetical protein
LREIVEQTAAGRELTDPLVGEERVEAIADESARRSGRPLARHFYRRLHQTTTLPLTT